MRSDEAYNVFQRRTQPSLRCAVQIERPVPAFIASQAWEFAHTVRAGAVPADFAPRAARQGSQMLGYYLFHALQE